MLPLFMTLVLGQPAPTAHPTADEARAFTRAADAELKRLWVRSSTAEWIKSTHITDDTERNAAAMNEDVMAYLSKTIKASAAYSGLAVDPETARMLYLLRVSQTLPAPSDPERRAELAALAAKLEGLYGKGKACTGGSTGKNGADEQKTCRDLQQLSAVLAKVGEPNAPSLDELTRAWVDWHDVSTPMRPLYERLVQLSNEGARDIGQQDVGELWRAGYDLTPAAFEKETERLWREVKPLYDELHCYVRRRLVQKYGAQVVSPTGPMPSQLMGNMWAQDWGNLYPLVEPYPGATRLDIAARLRAQKVDPEGLVRLGERFFTSMGFDPLPATFWERSQFVHPPGREVVCHASAWDVAYSNDLRVKMCISIDDENFTTVHHELGHDFYYQSYWKRPVLFQQGANDGFHEAIGDAITLSITPGYLKQLGLLDEVPADQHALINVQLKQALDRIAFLPFARLADQWRWDVFSGKTPSTQYNAHWWELVRTYQGVVPPVARSEAAFDPGAKYHIAANMPYVRYFLARILQFQFHQALCKAAGQQGPLHDCSVYGSRAAGDKLKAMLALGASKPWPDALETLTGERAMSARPLLEYFAPLQKWLREQNKGQRCGW